MRSERSKRSIITSIDIGTTKICVLIGKPLDDTSFEIIGVGRSISEGLCKGVVVDIGKTVYAIRQAVKEAELMAGLRVESAVIGISGGHISAFNSRGVVPIKKNEVRVQDIEHVLAAARAVPLKQDQQILHVLPQYFTVDGHDVVCDPLGMYGIRLEVEAHIILGAVASVQNLVHCCERAEITVGDIVLEQLASAEAVLSEDEQSFGIAVVDIGGGTSDIAIYQQGSIRHTKVISVAGNHFTQDLAIGLRITKKEAERIKKMYGVVHQPYVETDRIIEVEDVQGETKRLVSHYEIFQILEPRLTELLLLIKKELTSKKLLGYMPMGIVFTGGGSLLCGFQEAAQSIFDVPVRIGAPQVHFDLPQTLQNPMYATGYGMIVHALKKEKQYGIETATSYSATTILHRMKSWIVDLF